MPIYAIYNRREGTFVRYGKNGGGALGYCLYRGQRCFFLTRTKAKELVDTFDRPTDYEIRKFAEIEDGE